MSTARRRATYDDLLKVPDILVAEILDGELFTSPRPASLTLVPRLLYAERSILSIGGLMVRWRSGGWWILFEPELHLGADILVPDLAGWRRERVPVLPNVTYFELAPDWVCEVVSPSTARVDRVRKVPIYAREGVVTLVSRSFATDSRSVSIGGATLGVNKYTRWSRDRASRPFAALELDMCRWWLESEPEQA
jgi:hypothetical protein